MKLKTPAKKPATKKAPAKKAAPAKPKVEKFKINERLFWDLSNRIETLTNRLNSSTYVIELVAQSIEQHQESGALWAAVDMLREIELKMDDLVNDAMQLHRDMNGITFPKFE